MIWGQSDSVFLVGGDIQQKQKVQTFWLPDRPSKFPLLEGQPDLPIRKTLRSVLDLLTVMVLKTVSESIFFQINIITACKFKDKKEVVNSSRPFSLM